MTRNGKIARLPRQLRDSLNHRLYEGEQGKTLVTWLNSLPEVQEVLREYFNGVPISEQNLSEWKQGGFLDWTKHQESLEWVRQLTEQAEDFSAEAGPLPLSDRLSATVALALGRMLTMTAAKPLEEDSVRQELLMLFRELTLLRREDHEAARLKMALEVHSCEQSARERQEEQAQHHREAWGPLHAFVKGLAMNDAFRALTDHLPEEQVQELRIVVGLDHKPLGPKSPDRPKPSDQPDRAKAP